MINITISEAIKSKTENITLGCIEAEVEVNEHNNALWKEIDKEVDIVKNSLDFKSIGQLNTVNTTKTAYKKTGKDPNRYRPSAESLLRRIVKGNGLYEVNNVVDLLNLVSIRTGFSIGGYDIDKISGKIEMGVGRPDEPYEGIGRGVLNIEGLPVLRDDTGAFGSPTSDSLRTMVDSNTSRFLMVFFCFAKPTILETALNQTVELLEKYANATNILTSTAGF